MKFETRRERELRRKRQKRSAILGMVFAILVVIGLGILLWNGKKNIEAKNVEYEKEISQLQAQVDSEQKRTDELNEYKKYIQTKKFVEEVAKDKFGLVYPDRSHVYRDCRSCPESSYRRWCRYQSGFRQPCSHP